MSGLNKVLLLGNIGTKKTNNHNGNVIVNITLATSEKWKDKASGEKKEKTSWHSVTFFGKLAEIADKYLDVGSKVYIEGALDYGKYDKDGVTHFTTKITAKELKMLDSKKQDGAQQGTNNANNQKNYQNDIDYYKQTSGQQGSQNQAYRDNYKNVKDDAPPFDDNGFDDDIPF